MFFGAVVRNCLICVGVMLKEALGIFARAHEGVRMGTPDRSGRSSGKSSAVLFDSISVGQKVKQQVTNIHSEDRGPPQAQCLSQRLLRSSCQWDKPDRL